MSALIASFDPDELSPAANGAAIEAGAFTQFARFVRFRDAERRWSSMPKRRRQVWIADFIAALDAYRTHGGTV